MTARETLFGIVKMDGDDGHMPTEEDIPPEPHLMESMRAVGYTLDAAIADLIDNSITAGARAIDITFASEPTDHLAILDDGRGMTRNEAREAMRLAGRNAREERSENDLGRFGLGLKTASLSQCRDITLVTKTEEGVVAYAWNLDHLAKSGRWSLLALDPSEVVGLPMVDRLTRLKAGTLVLWRELDQLRAHVGPSSAGLDAAMGGVKTHLGLVFHRFIQDKRRPVTIRLNGNDVPYIDPFLSSHRRTQRLPKESFTVEGSTVTVQPYTIPRLSAISTADRKILEAPGLLRDSQGFYIYRARRLVIWGTWFRIQPRQDMAKLSRVQVDVPNTLDHLWALDIKKATAQPPPQVRARLKMFAEQVTKPSRTTLNYQGRKDKDTGQHVWELLLREDDFSYVINRGHPAVDMVLAATKGEGEAQLGRLLSLIESTLPGDDIFNRLAKDQVLKASVDDEILSTSARDMWQVFRENAGPTADAEGFIRAMSVIEPFFNHPRGREILRGATVE